MYRFKTEKYKELLNGKTVEWLSKEVGYTVVSLYNIFNGHNTCKKPLAYMIVKVLDDKNEIDYYFDEVEENKAEC